MAFTLPNLPYEYDALEPHLSAHALKLHHDKHHAAYVEKLNKAIKGTRWDGLALEDVVRASAHRPSAVEIFNNASQAWNHQFFWNSMSPQGGGVPGGAVARLIESHFDSFARFKTRFIEAGMGQFGSGWVWLALDSARLTVIATSNADSPLAENKNALLTCDLWEHAYYLDYENRREEFLATFLDRLASWPVADERLARINEAKHQPSVARRSVRSAGRKDAPEASRGLVAALRRPRPLAKRAVRRRGR